MVLYPIAPPICKAAEAVYRLSVSGLLVLRPVEPGAHHAVAARAVGQTSVFEAATYFARVEGILPAPESSHAIRVAIDEAVKCKETGEAKNIVFGLTGTGYFDMTAYQKFNDGTMDDYVPTDDDLEAGFAALPNIGF